MKKTITLVVMALFVLGFAQAFDSIDSVVVPGVVNMDHNDVKQVEYCVEYIDEEEVSRPAVGLGVSIFEECLDQNNLFGCQAGDVMNPSEFTATALDAVTDVDGCATLELETTDADGGLFYYTVNGDLGGSVVTRETASAYVPEFGVLGAVGMLAVAGLFIAKRRQ
ncbi:MAG: hypothetical protein HGA85_00595 [Nanoarchaeota archaeon]|nr:hypothetical protein [Nanoarchaeota archaeon]